MMDWILQQILLLAVSLAANFLSAMAGGGAGLIQLPALIFLGLPFATALATHKIASVALGVGATVRHSRGDHLEWRFALFILTTGLPGVVVGAFLILQIPEQAARIALGLLTVGLGIYSMVKPSLGQHYQPRNRNLTGYWIGGSVLFLLGVFNGSLTSGAGLFVTLWLVHWFGLDYKRATAYTLVLVGLFWNGTGASTLAWQAKAQWDWLPMLLLGSVLGGYWGAHWAITRGNPLIKRVFEAVTILVGVSLLLSSV